MKSSLTVTVWSASWLVQRRSASVRVAVRGRGVMGWTREDFVRRVADDGPRLGSVGPRESGYLCTVGGNYSHFSLLMAMCTCEGIALFSPIDESSTGIVDEASATVLNYVCQGV